MPPTPDQLRSIQHVRKCKERDHPPHPRPIWGVGGMITFLALAHMLNATQLVWGGGDDKVP